MDTRRRSSWTTPRRQCWSAWTRTGYWASEACVNEYVDLEMMDADEREGALRIGMKMRGDG